MRPYRCKTSRISPWSVDRIEFTQVEHERFHRVGWNTDLPCAATWRLAAVEDVFAKRRLTDWVAGPIADRHRPWSSIHIIIAAAVGNDKAVRIIIDVDLRPDWRVRRVGRARDCHATRQSITGDFAIWSRQVGHKNPPISFRRHCGERARLAGDVVNPARRADYNMTS